MPTKWQTFPIKLEGGLTTNTGRLEQGLNFPGSATKLVNYEASVEGGYSKVLGFSKFSSTAVPGTGLIFGVIALDEEKCLAIRDGAYQYSTGTTWTNKGTLPNPLITRIKQDTYNFDGTIKTVIVDGKNDPVIFNHTTLTITPFTAPPIEVSGAEDVIVFKNHVFFYKENLLTFAAPFTDQDFAPGNGAGTINIGDEITGLKVFREQLIVFSLNSIQRLVGNTISDFQLVEITKNTGCLDGNTIQEVGGDLIYLGPDGLRYLSATERNSDFGLARASEKVQKVLTSQLSNGSNSYASITISKKNQYRFFIHQDNVPSTSSEGYVATKYSNQSVENISWGNLMGFKVYSIDKYQSARLERILFSNSSDFVYVMDQGNSFDGQDIECIFETPYMPITDPKIRKTVYKHTLYARPSGPLSLDVTLKFDYDQTTSSKPPTFTLIGGAGLAVYGSPEATYGLSIYGATPDENFFNNTLGSGFVVAINYYEKSSNPSFTLNFTLLEYIQNERR
jgi:hypothetical protein